MGDLVGSIAGAAIEVLLKSVISLLAEEIRLIRNFKKDLENLKSSLTMIQAFMSAAEKQPATNEAVQIWLKNLEAVAFDAENVLDELNYKVLCKKMKTGDKLKIKVPAFLSSSQRTMACKIKDINDNLKRINKEAEDYGLQKQVGAHAPAVGSATLLKRETDSHSVEPIVFGRENHVARIVEKLTCLHQQAEKISVLPIVGMGGLGKTTLARLVFHHDKIESHFEKRIWVYVSENFDAKDIFKRILESITKKKVDFESQEALLEDLKKELEAEKYLLVLDDVWKKELGDFLNTLSNISSVKGGNGIVVTTRREEVASSIGTISIPKLSNLSDEDCWSIIKEKAFEKGCAVPSELETIGKRIATKCQGLPLAAKVMGGLLRRKSEDEWPSIEETMLSRLEKDGNDVMMILRLSFDNLPSQSLKKCFAFCSIFPKGFRIQREMLIYLWMSEGFLENDEEYDVETKGGLYFDLLLQNSLLQVGETNAFGEIECYSMHDLVHGLAFSVLKETSPVRYMHLKSMAHISKEDARKLRSLIFESNDSNNMMFSNLSFLRGLVLFGEDKEELPKVEDLIHLRYLDISATRIECLPDSIGNLYHMQTLRASNALKELPKTLKKLINLRHLHISELKHGLENSSIEEIPMLWQLPHLKSLYLEGLPNVRSMGSLLDGNHYNSVGKEKIVVFPALERLTLLSMWSMTELLATGDTQPGEEQVLMFPRLEQLELTQCPKLTSGPRHLPCLKELIITGMDSSLFLDNLLVNLTSLRQLDILSVDGLVSFPDEFFRNNKYLTRLFIQACRDLSRLAPSFGASLREIEIHLCHKLEELPEDLLNLDSLVGLRISFCSKLKSIPYNPRQRFPSLHRLKIKHCVSLTDLPIGMLESSALSLEEVDFDGLKSLTNMGMVIGCLQKMPRLTKLSLDFKYAPELANNSFPVEIGSFHSLRDLSISCGMENWERVEEQLQHLTALTRLCLCGLEIEAIPEWLGELPNLEELRLVGCEKLTSLPSKGAMKRLARLLIFICPLLNLEKDGPHSEWHKISDPTIVFVRR